MEVRTHTSNPTRKRHAIVAFIVARTEAEKKHGKPDKCVVDRDTFKEMLTLCNKQDCSIRETAVFRGVMLEVSDAKPEKHTWSFRFESDHNGAAPHDPVATAKWLRKRKLKMGL